jgi:hypothetical protein
MRVNEMGLREDPSSLIGGSPAEAGGLEGLGSRFLLLLFMVLFLAVCLSDSSYGQGSPDFPEYCPYPDYYYQPEPNYLYSYYYPYFISAPGSSQGYYGRREMRRMRREERRGQRERQKKLREHRGGGE